jgi:hypothetical protein
MGISEIFRSQNANPNTLTILDWVKEQCVLLLQGEINTVLKNLDKLIQHGKYKTAKYKMIKSLIDIYPTIHT